jgi:uncharacterized RDD family membrane protein YckC
MATPGKLAVGIRVTDLEGNRISFGRATGRPLLQNHLSVDPADRLLHAGFDSRKRAVHDYIAGTLVTYKKSVFQAKTREFCPIHPGTSSLT